MTGPYDLITAFDVIHDLARPAETLAAVAGALRDDGVSGPVVRGSVVRGPAVRNPPVRGPAAQRTRKTGPRGVNGSRAPSGIR